MSDQSTPAGFPGSDRSPLAIEEDRMARVLAVFDGAPAEEPTEEPGEVLEQEPVDPGGEEEPTEAPEEPETPQEEPEPTPAPAADLTAAIERVAAMEERLRAREAELEEQATKFSGVSEREKEIEKYKRFAAKAENEHFLDALEELGWDPDKVTKAIVHGRGVRTPKDEAADVAEQLRSEFQRELDAIKAANEERESVETQAAISRVLADEDRAPVIAAFGEHGRAAVQQRIESAKVSGERVPRDQAIGKAIDDVERELCEKFLKVALSSKSVRKKYASILGISDQAKTVTSGRPLSNRDASSVSRRAEAEVLTDDQRRERALRHLPD
ncbi:MAG: hypothetical protein RLP09_09610 [Sandaracinaceae bacterium]